MPHNTNIISKIRLPGSETVYEIHDEYAVHSAEELGIGSVLSFKGVVAAESKLPTTGNRAGDVYHVTADDCEYVWVVNGESSWWEKLGNIHDAASSTHKHAVTVTGKNAASAVTGSVSVPTVSPTSESVSGTAAAQTITKTTDNVLGEGTVFTTAVTGKGLGTVS